MSIEIPGEQILSRNYGDVLFEMFDLIVKCRRKLTLAVTMEFLKKHHPQLISKSRLSRKEISRAIFRYKNPSSGLKQGRQLSSSVSIDLLFNQDRQEEIISACEHAFELDSTNKNMVYSKSFDLEKTLPKDIFDLLRSFVVSHEAKRGKFGRGFLCDKAPAFAGTTKYSRSSRSIRTPMECHVDEEVMCATQIVVLDCN